MENTLCEKVFYIVIEKLGLVLKSKVYGLCRKSISGEVEYLGQSIWLKVSRDKPVMCLLDKVCPKIFSMGMIDDVSWVLMEKKDFRVLSLKPWLSPKVFLNIDFVSELKNFLDRIGQIQNKIVSEKEFKKQELIWQHFKRELKFENPEVSITHGDLNWGNVGFPFVVIDNQSAKIGFLGEDQAMLWAGAILNPFNENLILKTFPVLDTYNGKVLRVWALANYLKQFRAVVGFKDYENVAQNKFNELIVSL